jgi:hypothetical protein
MDVTFVTDQCTVVLSDPNLIVLWAKTLAHVISPDAYMAAYKALNPGDVDAVDNARAIVDACMGNPA